MMLLFDTRSELSCRYSLGSIPDMNLLGFLTQSFISDSITQKGYMKGLQIYDFQNFH